MPKYGPVQNEEVLPGLTYDKLATDTIRFEIAIPLLTGTLSGATTTEAPERYLISSDLLKHAKAAYFEISYDASALTANGSADLYDLTAGVITTITLTAGGSSERTRSEDILASLTAGNEVKVRVTGDGTNAATLRSAKLIIVLGVS